MGPKYLSVCGLCCFLVICVLLHKSYADKQLDGYYSYQVGGGGRERRYVDGVIARLADNYNDNPFSTSKLRDKDVLKLGAPVGFRSSVPVELVGNVPVRAALPPGRDAPPPDPVRTEAPVQQAPSTPPAKDWLEKKPVQYDPKKGYEGMKSNSSKKVSWSVVSTTPSDANASSSESSFDISSEDFPQEITNNTLMKHNITDKQVDHHVYYNSTFISDPEVSMNYWVDLENEKDVVVSEMLSQSHRRATTVKLKFDFKFYGQLVKNMTIATGGFLYTGDYIHSWLAATQYIAPLMANFDTSLSPNSRVKYRDNGTALTVEWERVELQDKKEAGEFSFQATLHKNGDIVFVYKTVPIEVQSIEDSQHPVKVGLSDAYIIDKTVFFVRRKTIYEYHRVQFKREFIKNSSVIYLRALPTCMDLMDCASCLTADIHFKCQWCEGVGRCSSGLDRQRQEWQLKHCDLASFDRVEQCSAPSSSISPPPHQHLPQISQHSEVRLDSSESYSSHTTGMLGVFLVVALVAGLAMWAFYAYRNPHTPSGQVFIKYRPSQWRLRRGEARYTAASIHM